MTNEKMEMLLNKYHEFKSKNLKLDMSRGKPCPEQIALSLPMLDIINSTSEFATASGIDCRNYGLLGGIPELKNLFAEILAVLPEEVFIGGNSSLSLMFDTVSCFMTHGVLGNAPWMRQGTIKFLCPVPGYDRHFAILSHFGIEPILVPMLADGPDMGMIENLVREDEKIKGIWCVPKYSNPQGVSYSDETVRRFANLSPAAKDFRIFWDNAYAVHDLTDEPLSILSIMKECKKSQKQNLPILFCSTSKITFPGSGVAALAASCENLSAIKKYYSFKTICHDKLNQLRHFRFLQNHEKVTSHMKEHAKILRPKFDAVFTALKNNFGTEQSVSWSQPTGGYFISLDLPKGCAKHVVQLCKEAGVKLTAAGATYPGGADPNDSNLRLAPTFPDMTELNLAMDLLVLCIKLAICQLPYSAEGCLTFF